MNQTLSPPPHLRRAMEKYSGGRPWLSPQEAAALLDCDPSSLLSALAEKKSLGTLEYYWAGSFLRISTLSVIRFLAGGYTPGQLEEE